MCGMLTTRYVQERRIHLERKREKVATEADALRIGLRGHVDPLQHASRMALQDIKLATLARIDRALDRISTGTYGRCLHCHRELPDIRLDRMPEAELCLTCADGRS
jgi:RNA polymerase-binding transcription factor DksA